MRNNILNKNSKITRMSLIISVATGMSFSDAYLEITKTGVGSRILSKEHAALYDSSFRSIMDIRDELQNSNGSSEIAKLSNEAIAIAMDEIKKYNSNKLRAASNQGVRLPVSATLPLAGYMSFDNIISVRKYKVKTINQDALGNKTTKAAKNHTSNKRTK